MFVLKLVLSKAGRSLEEEVVDDEQRGDVLMIPSPDMFVHVPFNFVCSHHSHIQQRLKIADRLF